MTSIDALVHHGAASSGAIDLMTDDVIEYVTAFLTPRDVLTAMQVNAYWRSVCERDSIWMRFCQLRWQLETPREILKACGTEDFYELYDYLDRNGLVPRGKYTTKNQLIWGKNRQQGADVWLTIAHRSDCRLLSTSRGSTFIQLRVVVQNLEHTPLTVDFQELKVYWKDGQQGRVMGVRKSNGDLPSHAPQLVALNGIERTEKLANQRLTLQWFEFAVVTVTVDCDDCEFESDFLERCNAAWVPIRRPGPCTSLSSCRCALIPDNYHLGNIRVPIVDESVVWKYYRPVSGRFMVLDHRSAPLKYPFSQCNAVKSPPRSHRKTSIS